MPWYKGLWVDHIVESHDDVLAFNAAMSGDAPHEAVVELEEPVDPPADDPAPPADPVPADPATDPPADPPADDPAPADPAALTPEQKAAELESKHSKAELAAMAEGLGIETKGMNKGQIAAALVQASAAA